MIPFTPNPGPTPETKGFVGERYDAEAGLQYLNARYYDPELGMFVQPDWFEVTKAGVGTNRYAYSGNDPVNARDPSGHSWEKVKSWWRKQVEIGRNRRAIAHATGNDVRHVSYNYRDQTYSSWNQDYVIESSFSHQKPFAPKWLFGGWRTTGSGRNTGRTGLHPSEVEAANRQLFATGNLPVGILRPVFPSRSSALRAARRDAGISGSEPFTVRTETYTKGGRAVLDDNGMPIQTRVHVYEGRGIAIQEHPADFYGYGVRGNVGAHFNVRPIGLDGMPIRNSVVDGTLAHYDWGLVAR